MTEWNSQYGRRRVVGQDGTKLFIQTGESSRVYQVLDEKELEREIKLDESWFAHNNAVQARAAEASRHEAADKAERRHLHGFVDHISGIKAERIIEVLNKRQGFSGEVLTRRAFIEREVRAGARVVVKGDRRLLALPTGSFYTERDTTATALDYAEYLVVEWGLS